MNLLLLLSSIVQYNMPIMNSSHNKRKCVETIKQLFIEGGGVWQKFAQILSGYEDIVGIELAKELQTTMFDCPSHCDKYSARIIKDAFDDKYDTANMKLIGSGTISQVHRVNVKGTDETVAIKVMHPNIKKDIKEACDMYESIKGRRHYLPESRVKFLMYQVLKSIDHMHKNGIFHRDIKP